MEKSSSSWGLPPGSWPGPSPPSGSGCCSGTSMAQGSRATGPGRVSVRGGGSREPGSRCLGRTPGPGMSPERSGSWTRLGSGWRRQLPAQGTCCSLEGAGAGRRWLAGRGATRTGRGTARSGLSDRPRQLLLHLPVSGPRSRQKLQLASSTLGSIR